MTSIGYGGEVFQRQARELISGPCLRAKAGFQSSNRTQSRTVGGLLTGHNTLRRHLHIQRLSDSPLRRRCGAEDETSALILCECEALVSLRHAYLGSFLEPKEIKSKYDGVVFQRQARELISGPCLRAKARFQSSNRTQSRTVGGLLTGHNTLRRHLHKQRLSDSPLHRRCGAEVETSALILCECEALVSLIHAYLGSFLEPKEIKSISLGAIWNFSKVTGLPQIDMGHKGPVN